MSSKNIPDWLAAQGCTSGKRPLEIYMFIDPLCPECWALEPVLKKLYIEYGRFFTIRYVLSGRLASLNLGRQKVEDIAQVWERTASRTGMSCDGSLWLENPIETPYSVSIAVKAAELQGKRQGSRYLRKLQELLFLEKQNISKERVLLECAENVGLDVDEFYRDLHSSSSTKAFQCDLTITSEMEVDRIPTLVFFNENIDEEGIKITGYYPYEMYVQILHEMLGEEQYPSPPPDLEEFLRHFRFVGSNEIAEVYNLSLSEVNREMKKLLLKQKVEQVPVKYGTFWRYNDEDE
ncbi:ClpXP adapter SpxH family protein [Litchfieldia alkalitelluris]|uniref:ClpXP adapter SpxH family protein n=1 Tax=Litchfieldia alkalitelluris TaxID=304268 RepID=UPI001F306314|nr:ClpXP adapter SpxH family protein [Litchfieldia alkalitelluris]